MKIIALTDIHGRTHFSPAVSTALERADLVLIAGDITNFGGRSDAIKVIERITRLNTRVLAVHGNCDRPDVIQALSEAEVDINLKQRVIDRTLFFGIGGSNKTPMHTPGEYDDIELSLLLERFAKPQDIDHTVLVSHAPPYRTELDRMFVGLHVGSRAVRSFIERIRPDMVVCGHIHEARGSERISGALVINPGPFPKHYAEIDMGQTIEFKLL